LKGVLRLFASDFRDPLNIGSDEMVSMIDMGKMALEYAGKQSVKIRHVPGPEGVRGRNSDNTLIKVIFFFFFFFFPFPSLVLIFFVASFRMGTFYWS